jgi:hypothetical protein
VVTTGVDAGFQRTLVAVRLFVNTVARSQI